MVRAIDVQQSILQTHSAERVQQTQQQHSDMQQRYFDLHLHAQRRLLKEKVQNAGETARFSVGERKEEKGKDADRRNRTDGNGREQPDAPEDPVNPAETAGCHVNIRV